MKYHIVSIGVSKHKSPLFGNLQFASKDAADFFNLFTSNIGGFGFKKLLIDNEATLSEVRTALGKELLSVVGPDDAFFFLFSGHGTVDEDRNGKVLSHYLLPYDATDDIKNTCVSVDYLKEVLSELPCKASFVFVDSCFSGSVGSKYYNSPRKKSLKLIKKFTEADLGKGNVIFTASKEDEEALEDPENNNGLFTFSLLKELQKKRPDGKLPVSDMFTPVIEWVMKRAKHRYKHTQTPTVNSYLEGVVQLPVLQKPLKVEPQTTDVPQHTELEETSFSAPKLEISNKEEGKVVNNLISFISTGNPSRRDTVEQIKFERFCSELAEKIKSGWELIFEEVGTNMSNLPNAVNKVEGLSYQFIILGAVCALLGSEKQMKIYSEEVSRILGWSKGKSGLVALITIPEIIIAEIIYSVGVISLARGNLRPLDILLNTEVEDPDNEGPPQLLFMYEKVHYCDALGGHANKIGDHIRETLKSYNWLVDLAPRLKDRIDNYQLQVNFILVMLSIKTGGRLWADFGRHYAYRLKTLTDKIKYKNGFRKQLGSLFGTEPEEIKPLFYSQLEEMLSKPYGANFWWNSITPTDLLTKDEKEQLENAARAKV